MDRGWGLALDNSDQVGFFGINKPVFGVSLSPRLDRRRSSGLIMFPVNSRGREDEEEAAAAAAASSPQRVVLGEVDFFAEKRRPICVKKESSHDEPSTRKQILDVNVS